MATCEQCGSISIRKAQHNYYDECIAFVTRRTAFVCHRCGWRARRRWTDDDLRRHIDNGEGGAEPDPELVILDNVSVDTNERPGKQRRQRHTTQTAAEQANEFELTPLNLPSTGLGHGESSVAGTATSAAAGERTSVRRRRARARRREILAAVIVTAIVMLVVIGSAQSCTAAGSL